MNRQHQHQGFVLVTSLIFLIVLSLLGVMAMRGSLFEERMAANDRDLALAREYAELALRDAERDILGIRFDGGHCAVVGCTNMRPAGTRPSNAAELNFWSFATATNPATAASDGGVGQTLPTQGVFNADSASACGSPIWSGADWDDGVTRTCAGTINAAVPTIPYGAFTDAPAPGLGDVPLPRYMIELFTAWDLTRQRDNKLFFRITAVGFGRTVGANGQRTSVTLQSVFSPS